MYASLQFNSLLSNRQVSVWHSSNGATHTKKVTFHRARLVLRWLTVRWYTVLVCNWAPRPTQPPILTGMTNE